MALNMDTATEFENKINDISAHIEKCMDLFDEEEMYRFKKIISNFKNDIDKSANKNRKLCIGIIGDVKAGKSSFLNTAVFDGKNVLPRASVPMTAALTKISYSETQRAVIHFYTVDDWENILKKAEDYELKMREMYSEYKDSFSLKKNNLNANVGQPVSFEKFEKMKREKIPETLVSSKQLVDMSKSINVYEWLGKKTEKDFDNAEDLDDYVGAKGSFTPIVNYVELQINDEALKDLEIIDTPGLNDPIISRSNKTKEFLSECDAALLLSPCSQFLPNNTVNLISRVLPSQRINNYLIIGSKLDLSIQEYNKYNASFDEAFTSTKKNLTEQYNDVIKRAIENNPNNSTLRDIKTGHNIYISSRFYDVAVKKEKKIALDEDEENTLNQLQKRFSGFEPNNTKWLKSKSEIIAVRKALNDYWTAKEKIFDESSSSLISDYTSEINRFIDDMIFNITSSRVKLENNDIDELENRINISTTAIDRSRSKIRSIFEIASNDCEKKAYGIKIRIKQETDNYKNIKIDTTSRDETRTTNEGFLGLKKVSRVIRITEHEASTVQAEENVRKYITRCEEIINKEYDYLVDKESIEGKVKDTMLNAFDACGSSFDEDDILNPLKVLFSEIQIPKFEISVNHYLDIIRSEFSAAYAENEEIHRLESLQSRAKDNACRDICEEIDKHVKATSDILKKQAEEFSDHIMRKISGELERLTQQAKEKELFIKRYNEFSAALKKLKIKD